ncbi:MAG: oxygen-independent coproporphyrinogen III oxidase [Planctomycetota bacterium]
MTTALPVVDRAVFTRYAGLSLPRHVAYPMPTWWSDVPPDEAHALRSLTASENPHRDLSLYLHIPFCEKMCRFCACNRTIMRRDTDGGQARVERYIDALIAELRERACTLAEANGRVRAVRQVHWGGGTPTFLSEEQITRLHTSCAELFNIAHDAEVSIEVDPRVTTRSQLETLHALGFNRISFGVQDFDPRVQEHVRRIQPYEMVRATTEDARDIGFESVNYDLIYGLPYQTVEGIADTIERTLGLRPDRIAFYHYAQIPDRIANQRGMHHDRLPCSDTKLRMLLDATRRFVDAGYERIGLDHFALPDERLARAIADGEINRSFQGMTTGAELDLVGAGCSAISVYPRTAYVQNTRDPNEYADTVLAGTDPVIRGMRLSDEDAQRQAVVMELYCKAEIDPGVLLREKGIDATPFIEGAASSLDVLERDGLIARPDHGGVRLTDPLGRVLMRNVAAAFDGYLSKDAAWSGISHAFSASA